MRDQQQEHFAPLIILYVSNWSTPVEIQSFLFSVLHLGVLQHSWSLQVVHCFYYSAFSSQHRSLHWNTTWHLAKHRHPLIFPQSTLFRYSDHITVPSWEESLQKIGEQEETGKKSPILQDWTHGSWILVHVNSEATLGSQTPPSKAEVWNLQISAHFSFLFFPFTDAQRIHAEPWQTLSQSFFRSAASIKTI